MGLIKIVIATLLLATALFATSKINSSVLKFEKTRFSKNERVKIKDVKINLKTQMPQKDWYGYIIDIKAIFGGNEVNAKDVIFSNGILVAPDLFDIKTGASLKNLVKPKLGKDYYNKEHLIEGSASAKNKIVVFSDPLCPFCKEYVPGIINFAKQNAKDVALYYYHFPLLTLHPAAKPLAKLMIIAKEQGVKDIELKVYSVKWDKYFTPKEKDLQKIVNAFNKIFKTSIALKEINNKKINERIFKEINMGDEMLIQGTPTIYINGKEDKTKLKYETLGM